MQKYTVLCLLLALASYANSQTNEGDRCTESTTSVVGVCTPAQSCQTAKLNYERMGIRPTFCNFQPFGVVLICCTDNNRITTSQSSNTNSRHVVPTLRQGGQRVSERKCEEYSRGVVETVEFIPLLPDPETMSVSTAKCDYTGVELIVGGENALQGEFPHMAAIGWRNFENSYNFDCGGSLISSKFVVTAAHCSRNPRARDPEPAIVRLGDQNIDPSVNDGANPIDVPIRRFIPHPDYKSPKTYNDIALVELASDVQFSAAIRPACLWTRPDFGRHRKALATGWGVINPDTREVAKELQKVSLSLISNEVCDQLLENSRNRLWSGFVPSQMCAGELRGGRDTCQGDSGSPLQVTSTENQCIFNLIGITSFGKKCAESGQPAVYTRVSSYLDWIEGIVWPGE